VNSTHASAAGTVTAREVAHLIRRDLIDTLLPDLGLAGSGDRFTVTSSAVSDLITVAWRDRDGLVPYSRVEDVCLARVAGTPYRIDLRRTGGQYGPNTIWAHAKPGFAAYVPKGTVFRSTRPKGGGTLTRAQTVKIHSVNHGYIDTVNALGNGRGFVVLPTLTWVGANSYWMDVQITPALAVENGWDLVLPDLDDAVLDVVPSFDAGYTDAWVGVGGRD
jgi:hypothetical protein